MSGAATDLVLMEHATFRGPGGPAFPATSWRLPSGERWVVRGRSGAGKSLFVAALSGRLPRLDGSLRHPFLEGRPGCEDSIFGVLPPGTIAVASMDQHRALMQAREFHQLRWHGSLVTGAATVGDFLSRDAVEGRNPFLVGAVDDDSRFAAARARETARFELEPLASRPLPALSNGELHRVLIARALMLDPRLLIVDDPYAGLDRRTRALLVEVLTALPEQGIDVLHVAARDVDVIPSVTHELELADVRLVYAGPRRVSGARANPGHAPARRDAEPAGVKLPAPPNGPERRGPPVLELRSVSVRHTGITLLEGVDWTILGRQRWALTGPNGAGKSTLISLVLCDHPQAHANDVRVCGRRLGPGTSIWDIKRHVGWVSPELDAHYPSHSSAFDVVASGFRASLGIHTPIGDEERAASAAWLELIGLRDDVARSMGDLPRLGRRLALLARACVHGPRLLLLDEPCQALDEQDRAAFAHALDVALTRLGSALVYVTHEAEELPRGVDHVLELEAGRVRSRMG